MKHLLPLLSMLILTGAGCIAQDNNNNKQNTTPEPIFCAQDAMQCPDGSYVGRTGPTCEFKCPE